MTRKNINKLKALGVIMLIYFAIHGAIFLTSIGYEIALFLLFASPIVFVLWYGIYNYFIHLDEQKEDN